MTRNEHDFTLPETIAECRRLAALGFSNSSMARRFGMKASEFSAKLETHTAALDAICEERAQGEADCLAIIKGIAQSEGRDALKAAIYLRDKGFCADLEQPSVASGSLAPAGNLKPEDMRARLRVVVEAQRAAAA